MIGSGLRCGGLPRGRGAGRLRAVEPALGGAGLRVVPAREPAERLAPPDARVAMMPRLTKDPLVSR